VLVAEPLLIAVAAAVLATGAWWTLLALLAVPSPRRASHAASGRWRFAVIVPAHNEEHALRACLDSLAEIAYDAPFEVVVVADNCTDATAAVAAEAGATVLERDEPRLRGKGYALEFAIDALAARDEPPQAIVFVDADTSVSTNLLHVVGERLSAGARAVQVHYAAAPAASELARLRRLAFALVHWARPLGAARLGLSTGLKGNGMALRWELAHAGLGARGVTEDAAMTLALARRGVTAVFEPRATAWGYMAPSYDEARVQDERWEAGRARLLGTALAAALHAAVRGRVRATAVALELAAPPLSALVAIALAALLASIAFQARALPLAAAACASLVTYVAIGLLAARAEPRDIAALRYAPRFVVHKLAVFAAVLRGRAAQRWHRTERGPAR
jgi:cellulose synthase/poly-beta-1,6-N-acetylglucosamine synthase-like glycosyltransferase